MPWYAFQVKDSYDRMSQYKEILEILKSDRYKKRVSEIFIAGNGKRENKICNYVFIKEDENVNKLWEKLCNEKYFMISAGYVEIPDEDMKVMKEDCAAREKVSVRYGDIVYIENGAYRKLYGIVLRIEEPYYEVGLNLCSGPLLVKLRPENIRVEKSLFEIWKMPR